MFSKQNELMSQQEKSSHQPSLLTVLMTPFSHFFLHKLPTSAFFPIVSSLVLKIGLNKKQSISLQHQADVLTHMLDHNCQGSLDESMLLSVLQGDLTAGEMLISDFDSAGNHQRPTLIKTLNSLGVWFMSLNINQQEKIKHLQQRAFRLSIG